MKIRDNIIAINHWPERYGHKVKGIVMHSMWGNYDGTIAWFNNPQSGVSAHYCIKYDGEITKCVTEKAAAWHAGNVTVAKENAPQILRENWGTNPNLITIGIEMEDQRKHDWAYPQRQYQASVELVADVCKRHGIIPNRGTIIMHKESDPKNKFDPHGNWDHARFVSDVRAVMEDGDLFLPSEVVMLANPLKVQVTPRVGLNVRDGWDTMSNKVDVLFYKEKIDVVGYVNGEKIDGNEYWWQTRDGLFIWSGGTNINPSEFLKGGVEKDMLKEEFLAKKEELESKQASLEEERRLFEEDVKALRDREEDLIEREEALNEERSELDNVVIEEPVIEEESVEEEVVEEIEEDVEEVVEEPVEEVESDVVIKDEYPSDVKDALVRLQALLEAVEEIKGKYSDYLE